jgi:hypothetical protein
MPWRKWIKPSDYVTSWAASLGKALPPALGSLFSHFTLFYLNKLPFFYKKQKKNGKVVILFL